MGKHESRKRLTDLQVIRSLTNARICVQQTSYYPKNCSHYSNQSIFFLFSNITVLELSYWKDTIFVPWMKHFARALIEHRMYFAVCNTFFGFKFVYFLSYVFLLHYKCFFLCLFGHFARYIIPFTLLSLSDRILFFPFYLFNAFCCQCQFIGI